MALEYGDIICITVKWEDEYYKYVGTFSHIDEDNIYWFCQQYQIDKYGNIENDRSMFRFKFDNFKIWSIYSLVKL